MTGQNSSTPAPDFKVPPAETNPNRREPPKQKDVKPTDVDLSFLSSAPLPEAPPAAPLPFSEPPFAYSPGLILSACYLLQRDAMQALRGKDEGAVHRYNVRLHQLAQRLVAFAGGPVPTMPPARSDALPSVFGDDPYDGGEGDAGQDRRRAPQTDDPDPAPLPAVPDPPAGLAPARRWHQRQRLPPATGLRVRPLTLPAGSEVLHVRG